LLELVIREVEIECLPDEIPEQFTVDVTELMMGMSVRASDVALSGSMVLLSPAENVIAHVVAMRAEEVVAAPAAAEGEAAAATPEEGAAPAAEPEVIKRGKKEEEGAEAETKGKKK
jgi:large subunit ribosomal protein L25